MTFLDGLDDAAAERRNALDAANAEALRAQQQADEEHRSANRAATSMLLAARDALLARGIPYAGYHREQEGPHASGWILEAVRRHFPESTVRTDTYLLTIEGKLHHLNRGRAGDRAGNVVDFTWGGPNRPVFRYGFYEDHFDVSLDEWLKDALIEIVARAR